MATKAEQTTGLTPAEILDLHIQEHREEMARFQEEHGDPEEAMRKFMRETFEVEAFDQTYREYRRSKGFDLDVEDDLDTSCPDV